MAEKKKVLVRKSAVKTHKQSEKARVRHKSRRNTISTMEKKLRAAVEAGDKDSAAELLKTQYAALDKAVKEIPSRFSCQQRCKESRSSRFLNPHSLTVVKLRIFPCGVFFVHTGEKQKDGTKQRNA